MHRIILIRLKKIREYLTRGGRSPIIKVVKRLFLLLSFLMVGVSVRVLPCAMTGEIRMACCPPQGPSVANPHESCCREGNVPFPSNMFVKTAAADFSAPPLIAVVSHLPNAAVPVSKRIILHETGPPKVPAYLSHAQLLL